MNTLLNKLVVAFLGLLVFITGTAMMLLYITAIKLLVALLFE